MVVVYNWRLCSFTDPQHDRSTLSINATCKHIIEMSHSFSKILFSSLMLLLGCASTNTIASGEISIENAWIAEAPPVSKVHAGYLTLHNHTGKKRSLTRVSSDAYNSIEMHLSIEKDGIASMQRMDKIEIDAGSSFEFKPGSYHLMLFTPAGKYKQGDSIELTFQFDDGTTETVSAKVKKHSSAVDHSHHHH